MRGQRAVIVVSLAGLLLTACQSGDAYPTSRDGVAPSPATAQCRVVDGKADRRCTPGALNPDVTQATIHSTICVPNWTDTIRPSTAYTNRLKRAQLAQYGETGALSDYKEDHLDPLEAGGNPTDPRNLFPQPTAASVTKNRDEAQAHSDICSGRKTLTDAQQWIVERWTHP